MRPLAPVASVTVQLFSGTQFIELRLTSFRMMSGLRYRQSRGDLVDDVRECVKRGDLLSGLISFDDEFDGRTQMNLCPVERS